MIKKYSINADWTQKEAQLLKERNINVENIPVFSIPESKLYEIKNIIQNAKNLKIDFGTVDFETVDYKASSSYVLNGFFGIKGFPLGGWNPYERNEKFLGGTCKQCDIRLNIQNEPITIVKEVSPPKSYPFFMLNGVAYRLFLSVDVYKMLFAPWGIEYWPVLIGKHQKVSENLVQLKIPISESPLCFGDSIYGYHMVKGEPMPPPGVPCSRCGNIKYAPSTKDFFPEFMEKQGHPMVYTQEIFSHFRRIVLSKEFAEFLIKETRLKKETLHLIPAKSFC